LVAVIGIRNHEGILAEGVEDRKAVGREGADPAGGRLVVQAALAFEPGVAEREAGGPHALELRADDELRALRSVRIDRYLGGRSSRHQCRPRTVTASGRSSICQRSRTQGAVAIIRCSQERSPWSVCSPTTAPPCIRMPVTRTGMRISTPSAWALPASPRMECMFSA